MSTFKCVRIDNISEIDPTMLNKKNLRCHYRTGVQVTDHHSRREKNWKYRHGVQTNLGDIELSVWMELVNVVIEYECEQDLFSQIKEWEKDNSAVKFRDEKELIVNAMENYVAELYDNEKWCDYIQFNQKYRPDKLMFS